MTRLSRPSTEYENTLKSQQKPRYDSFVLSFYGRIGLIRSLQSSLNTPPFPIPSPGHEGGGGGDGGHHPQPPAGAGAGPGPLRPGAGDRAGQLRQGAPGAPEEE